MSIPQYDLVKDVTRKKVKNEYDKIIADDKKKGKKSSLLKTEPDDLESGTSQKMVSQSLLDNDTLVESEGLESDDMEKIFK